VPRIIGARAFFYLLVNTGVGYRRIPVVLIAKRNGRGCHSRSGGTRSDITSCSADEAMLAEAQFANKSPTNPPTIAPATPTMLPPANAQAAAVLQMLPAAAQLNICRRSRTPSWAGTSLQVPIPASSSRRYATRISGTRYRGRYFFMDFAQGWIPRPSTATIPATWAPSPPV
jgi:hypothetical protein